ncbi:hypothetical protein QZH41_020221, partial [Actinostola sp. cb2023]
VKCREEKAQCLKAAGEDNKKKFQCHVGYKKCLFANRPTLRPRPTFPDFVVKCKIELAKCVKDAGKDRKKRFQCYQSFGKCLHAGRPSRRSRPSGRPRPTFPDFVVKCKIELAK